MELAFAGAASVVRADARPAWTTCRVRSATPSARRSVWSPACQPIASWSGLAVLTLLSAAAEERPLVCLVDDAQWLDQVSAQILAFVARRLLAESVALVFAVREPSDAAGVGGPAGTDGRWLEQTAMLGRCWTRSIPGGSTSGCETGSSPRRRGNPLALLELPRGSTAGELAGGFAVPGTGPLAGQIEHGFLTRVRSLPEQTQRLLLIAAAEPLGDADPAPARRRAARDRGRRQVTGRGRRADRVRCPGAVPSPAGSLRGLPGGQCR